MSDSQFERCVQSIVFACKQYELLNFHIAQAEIRLERAQDPHQKHLRPTLHARLVVLKATKTDYYRLYHETVQQVGYTTTAAESF